MPHRLPATTTLGPVTLRIADLDRSLAFYRDLLGFEVLTSDTDGTATLGANGKPLILLEAHAGLPPRPHDAPGLFHVAILLPDRPSLGAMLGRLARHGIRLGASDHIVSEALYLDDPDGNGLEIYCDRPRTDWRWHGGEVEMATEPMDTRAVLAQAAPEDEPYRLPAGTAIGHVHLQVGDLAEAKRFYVDIMGFDVTTESYPGALFVSAGGYHHHLGLNVWRSRGGKAAPHDRAGLERLVLQFPSPDAAAVRERAASADLNSTEVPQGFILRDPWGNAMLVTSEPA
ncbi:glyoxalase [Agaricicola taiwanensis]|uniref:Glyoxalase n=1 Tax=Agaricicola taiwanensis TaxID=591372 RepID=A0A8J2VRV9_9RHOB|nr:VOC family protein [Agaricicola taiwanensis]GGE39297.1 glyoxalase [Agaricicola taiwanensis]